MTGILHLHEAEQTHNPPPTPHQKLRPFTTPIYQSISCYWYTFPHGAMSFVITLVLFIYVSDIYNSRQFDQQYNITAILQ